MIKRVSSVRSSIERLSQLPWAFDGLRWILEGGFQKHRNLLSRHFSDPPRRILDCGCGTGIFANYFSPDAYLGIDISATYIAHARARYSRHQFHVMDATQLNFEDQAFDAVMVSGVVHHLDMATSKKMLAEIARVLRPDGTLLLWEDVPTRSAFNLVGHLVHRLDVGDYIRSGSEYAQLMSPYFKIESTEAMRSGFMDYAVFRVRRRNLHSHVMKLESNALTPLMETVVGTA